MIIRRILQAVSWLALAGTIVPSVAYLTDTIDPGPMKTVMLASTIVWFAATPLWMGSRQSETT